MAMSAAQAVCVMAGGAVGSLLRWLAQMALNPLWPVFPLGTLLVNAIGGLLIGAAMACFTQQPNEVLRVLFVTGVLGGFTTFSSFTYESLVLLQRGAWPQALAHTAAHVVGALVCAALGWALGTAAMGWLTPAP